MGLLGGPEMADIERSLYGDLEDDDELEAELLALQEGDSPPSRGRGAAAAKSGGASGGLSAPQSGMKKSM